MVTISSYNDFQRAIRDWTRKQKSVGEGLPSIFSYLGVRWYAMYGHQLELDL